MRVPATEFKAHCLRLMDRVAQTREEVVITKHGKAVARLVPVHEVAEVDVFGCMSGSVVRMGDIVSPVGEAWDAEQS
jgi:prevent-host-death family protein